jgi:ribonuclease HI
MPTVTCACSTTPEPSVACWEKPSVGWEKINVDASFLVEEQSGTWGAVHRDHNGVILRSAWGLIPHCKSVGVAEALACLEGLKMVLGTWSHNLMFESDCAAVVEAFNNPTMDRSEVGLIAMEFWTLAKQNYQVTVSKIHRNCNRVAHDICQFSRRELCSGVLQGSVPASVLGSALSDCNLDVLV